MSENDEYDNNMLFYMTQWVRNLVASMLDKLLKPVKEVIADNEDAIKATIERIDAIVARYNELIENMSEAIGENRTMIRELQKTVVNHDELNEVISNIETESAGLNEGTQQEHDKMMSMQGTIIQCLTDIKEAIENHNL